MKTKRSAFTLLEIMVVIVIIGLIAAMVIPLVHRLRRDNGVDKKIQVENVDSEFILIGRQTIGSYEYYMVKHKETGIVYISNYNTFTPLFDKDGKPLVKY